MSEIATNRAAVRPGQSKLRRNPRPSPRTETAFWEPVNHGWQVLYGGMKEMGVSIEWHDFELARDFDWSRHFHPDSLELCLNVAGHGSVRTEKTVVDFKPLTAGFYWQGKPTLQAERRSGEQHRFITIEFSVHFLRERLAGCDGALHPLVEGFVQGDLRSGGWLICFVHPRFEPLEVSGIRAKCSNSWSTSSSSGRTRMNYSAIANDGRPGTGPSASRHFCTGG